MKKEKKVDVSIIIVNWNCGTMIIDCVGRLIETIKNHFYEIIIVDNNSQDNSLELLKDEFGDKIKLIKNKTNNFFAKANNQGYKASVGKYIFILNPDTLVTSGSVDKMLSFMENNNKEVITCTLLNKDGSIQYLHRSFPTFIRIIGHFLYSRSKKFSFLPAVRKYRLLNNNYQTNFKLEQAAGTATLISRKMINKLGYLFDEEKFPLLYNDVDLCYRINKVQGKILCYVDAKIYHLKGASTKKLNFDNYSLHYAISSLNFFKKHRLRFDYFLLAITMKTFFVNYFLISSFFSFIKRNSTESIQDKKIILKQILLERFNIIYG